MNGHAQPALWSEARAADGRVYYYNTQTKATQWTKPAEMMTAAEKALTSSPWKEYSHEGRKYWHNPDTNETTWEMPEVLKAAQASTPVTPATPLLPPKPTAPVFVAGDVTGFQDPYRPREHDDRMTRYQDRGDRPHYDRHDRGGGYGQDTIRGSAMPSNEPDVTNLEEAEAIFHKLLRRSGVQPEWTWVQVVKATAKDPQYRAIKDPKDRKAAWERYVAELRAQDKDREKDRQAKLRTDFYQMLRRIPAIRHYTRWNTAKEIIQGETVYRSAKSEQEAQAIFNDYRAELLKAHNECESNNRKSALDRLVTLLQDLELGPYTRWAEADKALQANPTYKGDESFSSLSKIDVLKAFENHIKALERSFNEKRQREKAEKARRERRHRDAYGELLRNLQSAGKIRAGTKWTDVHNLIEDDPRYVAMLGQSGSTPLDLFWDILEEEDRALRNKRNDALDVLEDKRYELTQKTSYDEFASLMQTDRRTSSIDSHSMRLIYERLREKVMRRSDEEHHQQRKAIDALRSRIKRLDPQLTVNDTWESIKPRIEKTDEYLAVDTDESRKVAFEKVLRRTKEREDERERERSRREHRDRRDGRDARSSRGEPHRASRHRTRTPEVDPYEADRRKAQADREKRSRRPESFGLSPPPRDRHSHGDDRYEGRGHNKSASTSSHYERERREREAERERQYMSRADPRDTGASELDYGDSKPTSVRRRRDDSVDGRDAKRLRSEGASRQHTTSRSPRRSHTPAKDSAKDSEVAYKSGSEEGEIEEE